MKFGAEPKKVVILGVLLAIAAFVLYTQVFSGPSDEPAPRRAPQASAAPIAQQVIPSETAGRLARRGTRTSQSEFRPRVGVANPKDRPDPATINPEIRFDLLARLEKVDLESTGRNIFQMGAEPIQIGQPAGPPKPLPKMVPTIPINHPVGPGAPPATAPAGPQAPPITFRYYGFEVSRVNGRKRAFLLDGDDILVAGENDTVKSGRYKVTRIGVNSITIEDTQFNHSQTLPLEELIG